jgi:hypothetical protein
MTSSLALASSARPGRRRATPAQNRSSRANIAPGTGHPSEPHVGTDYIHAKPLCSPKLLSSLRTAPRGGPPPAPPWKRFSTCSVGDDFAALVLADIFSSIVQFLSLRDTRAIQCTATLYRDGPLYADVHLSPPWPPMRSRVFGKIGRAHV